MTTDTFEQPASDLRKGLFIRTYGCQMNIYDSQKVEKILESDYRLVDSAEAADLVIVNTCSVRDKAEHKLYSYLGEMRELKETKPHLMVGVGGCVAQQEGDALVKRSPAVDFVYGTHNLSLVPSLIARRQEGLAPQVAVDYRDDWEELPLGIPGEGRISVLVSISRGCNKNCTYCIVPTTRGPEVSRKQDEIEREVRIAVHRGAKEIVLLGQTVNSWGRDFAERRSFSDLLQAVSEIPGVERIRFVSPHPQEMKSEFIDLVARNPKIARHMHMPVQSGSDRILKAMNRNYRRERYLAIVEELKAKVPGISFTTDVIVGFPGETDQDFQDTMDVINHVAFDGSYSYMFSPRPGTVAATLGEQVPSSVALERLQVLQARQNEITTERLLLWEGQTSEVLLDGPSKENPKRMSGRLSQNIVVNLLSEDSALSPGDLVKVKITKAARYTLKGEVVGEAPRLEFGI